MAIELKSPKQLELMREGGRITAAALQKVLAAAVPGTPLIELEEVAERFILSAGGEPAFKRVPGYDFTTCLNLNEGVVHGIPDEHRLRSGDILTVDLGTFYRGFNTDHAWTILVGDGDGEKRKFLEVGESALRAAIEQSRVGNCVEDISQAMEAVLREGGYTPVEVLTGHGVGRALHEDPQIPCLVTRAGGDSHKLVEGATLAVEVIYTAGSPELKVLPDGWTVVTADGSLAGLFEHSIAVTHDGPIVLTRVG